MTSFVSGKRYPDNAKGGIPAGSENEGGLLYAGSTGTDFLSYSTVYSPYCQELLQYQP